MEFQAETEEFAADYEVEHQQYLDPDDPIEGDGLEYTAEDPADHVPSGQQYREVQSIPTDGADRFGVSTVHFDLQEELLWTGNQGGHVTSYYGLEMQKYTSFQIHATNEIRQILTVESGMASLTSDTFKLSSRGGIPRFEYRGDDIHDMQCMLLQDQTTLWMGGHHDKVTVLDLNTGTALSQHQVEEAGVAIFRRSNKFVCCGDASGKIGLRDPNTMKLEHTLEAHSNALSDFDIQGHQLITCGLSNRMGTLTADRFLMVYDLRMVRALQPIQVPIDPMLLRFVPTYANRMVVVSQSGQFQVIDSSGLMTADSMVLYHVKIMGNVNNCFEVSSTYKALAFGDSGGYLHLWADGETASFNPYSRETIFAPPVRHPAPINIMDNSAPLSAVPIPLVQEPLLSEWPRQNAFHTIRKSPIIEPGILSSMRLVHFIGYAPNPHTHRRNQVAYKEVVGSSKKKNSKSQHPNSPKEASSTLVVPKAYQKVEIKYSKLGVDDFDFRYYNKTTFSGLETHIPNAYCNSMLQVLYFIEPLRCAIQNHLCQKEFCLACELGFLFHMFDKSKGHNCQASNFLRAFRTIPEAAALDLILGDAEESSGKGNLPRRIQSWNRFVLQQLLQDTNEDKTYQSIKTTTTAEEKRATDDDDESSGKTKKQVLSSLFESQVEDVRICRCGEETVRNSSTLLFNLMYNSSNPRGEEVGESGEEEELASFPSVVRQSMCLEQTTQAWCEKCNKYQPSTQKRKLKSLPDVLVLNCNIETEKEVQFWKAQQELMNRNFGGKPSQKEKSKKPKKRCRYGRDCKRRHDCKFSHGDDEESESFKNYEDDEMENSWLPVNMAIKLKEGGDLEITEVKEEKPKFSYIFTGPPDQFCPPPTAAAAAAAAMPGVDADTRLYQLHACVLYIQDPQSGGNLVAHVLAGPTYHKRKEGITHSTWYLFNDFSIAPIEQYEATSIDIDWQLPCVLYYIRKDLLAQYECKISTPIDESVLFEDASIARRQSQQITFKSLGADEIPQAGDLVGIDAEFVTLNQEEAEIRSDGTRSTIKPSQMSVARISCVRGAGQMQGIPFIDDYISTQEQVVDYLTKFSGIKPGDLDATISSKHLTTLKTSYLKLRYLVDKGIKFVGHGLKKDFRVINLLIPYDQVIDTASLFNLPKQRILSLRFLAWYFLGLNIQGVTHDSIEDARTALHLYNKYLELSEKTENQEKWNKELKKLYEEGRKLQWKIPGTD